MHKSRKHIVICLLLLSVLLATGVVIEMVMQLTENSEIDLVKWTADLDGWTDHDIPIGTMERLLREAEQVSKDSERLTVYRKEEIVAYLDKKIEITLPSGLTNHVREPIYLTKMHERFPIEWVAREESDPQTGRDCIRVVYKVQNQEGNIEYISVYFQDFYSNRYMKFDESNMVFTDERETDASGNIIKERVDDKWEYWCTFGTSSYSIQDTLE